LTIGFFTCHFCTAEAASDMTPNSKYTKAHCTRYSLAHSPLVTNTLFNLLSNRLGNQLRVGFKLTDFLNIDMHGLLSQFLKITTQ
jgi:hypothetical protein